MPNHTVQCWAEWVALHNDDADHGRVFPRDVPTTILIGMRPNGVRIELSNGVTASIQWTIENYCTRSYSRARRSRSCAHRAHIDPHDPWGSRTAELAFWNSEGVWYDFGSDTVIGHQTVEETRQWLMKAASSTTFLPLNVQVEVAG